MGQREEKKSIEIEQNINGDQTKLSDPLDVKRGDPKGLTSLPSFICAIY